MNAFEYVTADNFQAAAAFLEKHPGDDTLVKAGGIDVLDRLKEGLATPDRLLNLRPPRRPADPVRTSADGQEIVINALATLAEVAAQPHVRACLPALADAADHAATPQIRNVATVGGNLCQTPRCWYYRSQDYRCLKKGGATCYAIHGDNRYHAVFGAGACHIVHPSNLAVPLLACGAAVRLVRQGSGRAEQRDVMLDDFFRVPTNPRDAENILEPGELIQEVRIAEEKTGPRSAYLELREKQSFDWPMVSCAVNLNDAGKPRVVLGAVAPIPWRLPEVEALLTGRDLTDALIDEAKALATQGANPMAHNEYKVQLVGVALARALRQADEKA